MRLLLLVVIAGFPLLTSCSAPGGSEEVVLDLLLTDDTIYAPGYSDAQFNSIEPGMLEAEVLRRLGGPVVESWSLQRQNEDGARAMRWSRSAHDSNYKVRVVIFRGGRVSRKVAEFYVD